MPILKIYLKQCEVWAIALRRKYTEDPFFRRSLETVVLQSAAILVGIGVFWWVVLHSQRQLVVFLGISTIAVTSIAFSILLARFTLRITRDTNNHQKLFISNVAHELRTPLSIIKTSTEVALLDTNLPTSARKTFQDSIGEINRISEIINNLLSLNSLTRPERMKFKRVNLATIVDTVLKRKKPLAYERGITLRSTKNYGPYREVWGNALALDQVISALVKNAINYTPKGARGLVTISTDTTVDGIVRLSIEDSGIGISQKDLPHIFDPFYRTDTSRVRNIRRDGAGLGLTVVKEIVQAHNGKVQIQSIEHNGTTVSIFLPTYNSPTVISRKYLALLSGRASSASSIRETTPNERMMINQ